MSTVDSTNGTGHRWFETVFRVLSILVVLLYAFVFCVKSGERGFFPLDQSRVFDGAYRVLSGQVPYKDFVLPVGPMVFWIQSFVFKLGGINYSSYLTGAAIGNLMASALAMLIISMILPQNRWLTIVAGFLTATWFYPVYGTPNMEQTASLFSYLGLTCSIAAFYRCPQSAPLFGALHVIAGICAVLSFLSEQYAGTLILPAYLIVVLTGPATTFRRRGLAVAGFLVGIVLATAGFLAWIVICSSPANFVQQVFVVPIDHVKEHFINQGQLAFFKIWGMEGANLSYNTCVASVFLGLLAIIVYAGLPRMVRENLRTTPAIATLCIWLTLFQGTLIAVTKNEWQECIPFVGVIVAFLFQLAVTIIQSTDDHKRQNPDSRGILTIPKLMAFLALGGVVSYLSGTFVPAGACLVIVASGCLIKLTGRTASAFSETGQMTYEVKHVPVHRRFAVVCAAFLLTAGIGLEGVDGAWTRVVHETPLNTKFSAYSGIGGLESLKWGMPTYTRSDTGMEITEFELAELIAFLREQNQPFFTYPDFTIFYGLTGLRSPQPLLWFQRGLTYPNIYDGKLDQWIVDSLERNAVQFVIVEETGYFGMSEDTMTDFLLLKAYVEENFVPLKSIGGFSVRERRDPSTSKDQ